MGDVKHSRQRANITNSVILASIVQALAIAAANCNATKQAAMIAYNCDLQLMLIFAVTANPLVLVRRNGEPPVSAAVAHVEW